MKTFVIAQHHGVFLTLESLLDCGVEDITVIIPGSQVEKYNNMYKENPTIKEFEAFKDYDKAIGNYIKSKNANIKAFVYDDFNIRNTVSSAINFISLTDTTGIVACLMSGAIVLKDYTTVAKDYLAFKEFGMCLTRVYQNNNQLSMYHMIGLPQIDKSVDVNFFLVDMSKVTSNQLNMNDTELLNDAVKRKQLTYLDRELNGKDDPLIGTAISARQTLAHQLKMQAGYVINIWNKSIKPVELHKSEEIYGYPFHIYGQYVKKVDNYLPRSTVNKIVANGNETLKCTSGLFECLDIIDL